MSSPAGAVFNMTRGIMSQTKLLFTVNLSHSKIYLICIINWFMSWKEIYFVFSYIYWTDWGQRPRIERARLDGSQREVFINSSIQNPFSLAIDYDTNELYWCDQSLNKIVRVDIATKSSCIIVRNVTDAMSLAVSGDYVYWIDVWVNQ